MKLILLAGLVYLWGLIGIIYHTWNKASLESIKTRGPFKWDPAQRIAANLDRLFDQMVLDVVRYGAENFHVFRASLITWTLTFVAWRLMKYWGPWVDGQATPLINAVLGRIGFQLPGIMFLATLKAGWGMVLIGYLIDSGYFNRKARKMAITAGLIDSPAPGAAGHD
jgi:hypothetical protein